MTPQEALALAERAIRRGSCSAHKVASEGCATCEAGEEAIRVLRGLVCDDASIYAAAFVSAWTSRRAGPAKLVVDENGAWQPVAWTPETLRAACDAEAMECVAVWEPRQ